MIATTIEQSKRLLELGLNPESADMKFYYNHMVWDYETFPCVIAEFNFNIK